jgi:hypothetical protein
MLVAAIDAPAMPLARLSTFRPRSARARIPSGRALSGDPMGTGRHHTTGVGDLDEREVVSLCGALAVSVLTGSHPLHHPGVHFHTATLPPFLDYFNDIRI